MIANVDVFVSLHRAEGFGLVMAEAMLLGTACVATNWSSNTEFMDAEDACMVPYHKVEITKTSGNYKKGCVWAEPDVEAASVYIKRLYEEPEYYTKLVQQAERKIGEKLGKERVVQLVEERLSEILQKN